jgi:hypothetical protein
MGLFLIYTVAMGYWLLIKLRDVSRVPDDHLEHLPLVRQNLLLQCSPCTPWVWIIHTQ